jgi:basic membrane protein A
MCFKPTLLVSLIALSGAAWADPAVIYDMGGKFDKSFNQAAFDGAERWKKETGKGYQEFEISNPAQREQAKRRMAERGANPIVGIGFSQGSSMEKVAKDFPKLQFAIIDAWSTCPTCRASCSRNTKAASWWG